MNEIKFIVYQHLYCRNTFSPCPTFTGCTHFRLLTRRFYTSKSVKPERFKIMQWSLNILFYFRVYALGKSLGWFICTRPFQQSHREQPISRAPLRRQYLTSWLSIDKYWSLLLWQEASGKTWDVYLLCWILILSLSKLSISPSQTDLLCFFRSRPCDALFQLWFSFLSNCLEVLLVSFWRACSKWNITAV